MIHTNRAHGQNISGVLAAMHEGKGARHSWAGGSPDRQARATAGSQATCRKVFGPVPLSDAELAILRQIERVRG